jgi:hypothetical protein
VPAGRIEAALPFLRTLLERRLPADAGDVATPSAEWRTDWEHRAYAAHVLALAGAPAHGWNARLMEMAPRLGFAARMHAAQALRHAGRIREAAELLRAAGLPAPRPRSLGGTLDSGTRDLALALHAWLVLLPDAPETELLAQRLLEQGPGGHWGTTQDNAWAIFALGLRAERQAGPAQPWEADLLLPGANSPITASSTQPLHWTRPAGAEWTAPVRLTNRGPGPCLYSAVIEHLPAGSDEESRRRRTRSALCASCATGMAHPWIRTRRSRRARRSLSACASIRAG